jgi:hypothetical protein
VKIALLNSREAFETIFARSLERFAQSFLGRAVELVAAGQGELAFRQNAQLNLIYPNTAHAADLRTLSAEFRYAPRLLARMAQTAYCALAVTPPTSTLLSPRLFDLRNPAPEMAGWVFLPGNHTIRVIDIVEDRSIVFVKDRFDTHFLLNDARIRADHPELPTPRVLQINEAGGWYVEERIVGLPINRLTDQRRVETALGDAARGLEQLRTKTAKTVSAKAYGEELMGHIGATRPDDPILAAMVADFIRLISKQLAGVGDFNLTLCRSHGDFQPSNILASTSQTWVIDWEYSEIRSAIYDYLVYTSRSRFAEGFGARIIRERDRARAAGRIDAWGFEQFGDASALISVFLLEDLHLRLREVATEEITDKGLSIAPWLQQAKLALQVE